MKTSHAIPESHKQRRAFGSLFIAQPDGRPGAYVRRATYEERAKLSAFFGGKRETTHITFRGHRLQVLWLSMKETTKYVQKER